MDLCNKAYGFLHLPSLFVFLNPYSHTPAVRRFFLDGMRLDQLSVLTEKLSSPEARELVQTLTCYVHERKHFHDLLITPYGNEIVRQAFRAALVTSALFADRRVEVPCDAGLPLRPSFLKTPELLPRAIAVYEDCTAVFEKAILTLEASAVLAQRQFAWTHFGLGPTELLDEDFIGDPRYSTLLTAFWHLAERVSEGVAEVGVMLHRLLLVSLGAGPTTSDRYPDRILEDLLSKFASMSGPELSARLVPAIERGWEVTLGNMQGADQVNEEFLDGLRRAMRTAGNDTVLTESVCQAFDEFRRCAHEAREEAISNPRAFLRLDGYADFEGRLIEPCLYHYSVVDEDSLFEQPLDLGEGEFVAQHVYELEGGRRLYSHRVSGAEVQLGKRRMDARVWVDFMQGVGGSVALLEEVDWLHPVKTIWLRQMEEGTGLRFYRRLSDVGIAPRGTMIE